MGFKNSLQSHHLFQYTNQLPLHFLAFRLHGSQAPCHCLLCAHASPAHGRVYSRIQILYPRVISIYQTFFVSEENVYLLCKTLCEDGAASATGSDLFVVFISIEKKQASMFLLFIVIPYLWPCFVLMLQESDSEPLVWDLDSTLPFPSPLGSYVSETIQPSFQLFAGISEVHLSF